MLDVSGMKCGGCSASVKRILMSNPAVEQAAVNLLTESAVIKLRTNEGSAAEAAERLTARVNTYFALCNYKTAIGDEMHSFSSPSECCQETQPHCSYKPDSSKLALAVWEMHDVLTATHSKHAEGLVCIQGFPAKVRDVEEGLQDSAESAEQRKREELQRSLWDLGLSWGLVLVCCTHHLGHWLHSLGWHSMAHGPILDALANPAVSLTLGSVALLGPGRPLIKDGLVSLVR